MERREIAIRGIVQGVGFRPFVYGLASRLKLNGFVRNSTGGVHIEVEGERGELDRFLDEIRKSPPPLSRIEELHWRTRAMCGEASFRIEKSEAEVGAPVMISPDVATCDECLAEMFDPGDRRYRYPFLNCTNCGPRLTIISAAPYDRQRTTMAGFEMCAECRREYEDPTNRRFHAQPTACAVCGPKLMLFDANGKEMPNDPIAKCAEAIGAGKIVAIKGLGGYHLACDARNEEAVRELRRRKHRDEKPFAVMVRDVEAARFICEVSQAEEELLRSAARPIVLLRRSEESAAGAAAYEGLPDNVAPRNPNVGVMLPYTPVHHLLFSALSTEHSALIMTSGNRADEPIATGEPEVFERLRGIADLFLTNNRGIHVRCDDSVVRVVDGRQSLIRRSRGYAPRPIRLRVECAQPILAVGGQLKNTFALARGRHAIVSHHIGDLDHYLARAAFERDIALYEKLFEIAPAVIAHDLHPDYGSTRYAQKRARETGAQLIAVQHHHAHMASCMAEHGLHERVIGVSLDGTGYGTDGAIWGGEFLVGDLVDFRRVAHLRYVPMPGGESAIKQPWRMAISYLRDAGLDDATRHPAAATIGQMLAKNVNCPPTSSMGRLFDAVAALIGVRQEVSFEGQAAVELEALAARGETTESYEFQIISGEPLEISAATMIRAIVEDLQRNIPIAEIARKFQNSVARLIGKVCKQLRETFGIETVVLSGGVCMNTLLMQRSIAILSREGFRTFAQELVPANDGGLSLGQIAVAAARMERSAM